MPRVCQACGREVADAAFCPFCSQPTIERLLSPVRPIAPVTRSDALTIRKLFEQRKRWLMLVHAGCFFMFMAGGLLTSLFKLNPGFCIFPFAGFAISIIYARSFAFRCPPCGNNWDLLALVYGFGGIDKKIHHCPFCGVDIDQEIDPESHKPMEFLKEESGNSGLEIKNTNIRLPPGIRKGKTDK